MSSMLTFEQWQGIELVRRTAVAAAGPVRQELDTALAALNDLQHANHELLVIAGQPAHAAREEELSKIARYGIGDVLASVQRLQGLLAVLSGVMSEGVSAIQPVAMVRPVE